MLRRFVTGGGLIALFLVAFGGIFLAFGIWYLDRYAQLQMRGAATTATVVERLDRTPPSRVTTSSINVTGTDSDELYLVLRFTPAGGDVQKAEKLVSRERFARTNVGDEVALLYLPEDPGVFELADSNSHVLAYICCGVGGLVGVLGLLLAAGSLRRAVRSPT